MRGRPHALLLALVAAAAGALLCAAHAGDGPTPPQPGSVEFQQQAAAAGNLDAMLALGERYRTGRGLKKTTPAR